jgi:hypothetical protein
VFAPMVTGAAMAASARLGAVLAISLCLLLTGAAARHRHKHERYQDDAYLASGMLAPPCPWQPLA